MASVLFISKQGDGIPLALRLASEGVIVKMYINDSNARGGLSGYRNPSQVQSIQMIEQYDLVLFDGVGLGQRAEELSRKGRLVLGGGAFQDKLELDQEYSQRVVERLTSMKTPKGVLVNTKEELLIKLKASTEPLVLKKNGFVLESDDEINRTLLSFVESVKDASVPCFLQDHVQGIEIRVEGWFNGKEWAPCFNYSFDHTRLMEGERGPKTAGMGNVVWMTQEDEAVRQILLPLTPLLQKVSYLGPLGVRCVLQEEGIYFLEFTSSFSYDSIQALSELYKGKMFDFLWKVGSKSNDMSFRPDYAISVRMSLPSSLKGLQMLDIENGARSHVFLSDVMMKEETEVLAGLHGIIGCVTARGETIQEVRRRAYRTLDRIVIHRDVQFRKDIGAGVEEKISKLKEWGWLNGS